MADTSKLDAAVGRTSASESGGDGRVENPKDAENTPKVLWVAVILMVIGVVLVGAGVVALSSSTGAAVAFFIAGAVIGLIGAILGLANGIMSNVE